MARPSRSPEVGCYVRGCRIVSLFARRGTAKDSNRRQGAECLQFCALQFDREQEVPQCGSALRQSGGRKSICTEKWSGGAPSAWYSHLLSALRPNRQNRLSLAE